MPTRKFDELLKAIPAERRNKITARVQKTISAMPLDELRRARQLTQAKLAESLGINQGEVSKIENRTDLYLSTLTDYVEALGGTLEYAPFFLIVKFASPNLRHFVNRHVEIASAVSDRRRPGWHSSLQKIAKDLF